MSYFVYILRTSKNTLYVGQTNNLERRLKEHKEGKGKAAKYIRYFSSFGLVYKERYNSRAKVMRREAELKSWPKTKKEKLIMDATQKNEYYQKEIYLAQVDKNDEIIGQVERWQAHEQGILHRGFTAILLYQGQILLQHRKHIAFDNCWDLTFSSHQIYQGQNLESDKESILNTLSREWNLEKINLDSEINLLGKIYYKAKDLNSIFTEHEIDYIYFAQLKKLPSPNLEYAYGFKTVKSIDDIGYLVKAEVGLAPWVKVILKEIDLKKILERR